MPTQLTIDKIEHPALRWVISQTECSYRSDLRALEYRYKGRLCPATIQSISRYLLFHGGEYASPIHQELVVFSGCYLAISIDPPASTPGPNVESTIIVVWVHGGAPGKTKSKTGKV